MDVDPQLFLHYLSMEPMYDNQRKTTLNDITQ
jgi:hypothetical protein